METMENDMSMGYDDRQGWTLAPAHPPMAGHFYGGQVNID